MRAKMEHTYDEMVSASRGITLAITTAFATNPGPHDLDWLDSQLTMYFRTLIHEAVNILLENGIMAYSRRLSRHDPLPCYVLTTAAPTFITYNSKFGAHYWIDKSKYVNYRTRLLHRLEAAGPDGLSFEHFGTVSHEDSSSLCIMAAEGTIDVCNRRMYLSRFSPFED